MNKKLSLHRYFYLVVVILICSFMGFVSITPSKATGGNLAPFLMFASSCTPEGHRDDVRAGCSAIA